MWRDPIGVAFTHRIAQLRWSGKTSLLRLIAQEMDGDPETNAADVIAPA